MNDATRGDSSSALATQYVAPAARRASSLSLPHATAMDDLKSH